MAKKSISFYNAIRFVAVAMLCIYQANLIYRKIHQKQYIKNYYDTYLQRNNLTCSRYSFISSSRSLETYLENTAKVKSITKNIHVLVYGNAPNKYRNQSTRISTPWEYCL